MNKVLKIGGGIIAALLLILLALPFFLKDKVKDIAVGVANDMLDAEVYINDVDLSFFKNFPNASVIINKFGVKGKDAFEGDTLADVGELVVVVNALSLLKDNYDIKKVELNDANLYAKINKDGKANWDIMKSDSTETEAEDTTSSAMNIALEKISVNNLSATYHDMTSDMRAKVNNLNLFLKGDLALDAKTLADIKDFNLNIGQVAYSDSSKLAAQLDNLALDFNGSLSDAISQIKANIGIDSVTVRQGAITYLSKVKTTADINLEADLENNKYTFGDNNIAINEINVGFDGFVQLIDSIVDMDIKLNSKDVSFKSILSLVPAIYKSDFNSIQTAGTVSINASAKGRLAGENLPAFNAAFDIKDAMFKYPDLPSKVKNINISANAKSNGGVADNIVLDVNKLAFDMAGNPFAITFGLKTPISDPDFKFTANGKIDFSKISEIVHIDDLKLKGILTADLRADGLLSYVEKEQFDKFNVIGKLGLNNFDMKAKGVDYTINIDKADMDFTTQNVNLDANILMGESDLTLKGKLSHFIQYVLRGEEIIGELNVASNHLNVNQLMGDTENNPDDAADVTATESDKPLSVPSNINFAMNIDMKKVDYENIQINNIKGKVSLKRAIARISDLYAESMGGTVRANGVFNAQDSLRPKADADLIVNNMQINEVFTKIKTAKAIVPLFSDAQGKFHMNANFNTVVNGSDLSPVLSTVNAKGTFQSEDIILQSVPALSKIAEKVKVPALNNPALKDIAIHFKIEDGKLAIDPVETFINYSKVNISGWSGLDKTLGYVAKISLPKNVQEKVNKFIPELSYNVNIGGTFSDPKITVSAEDMVSDVKEAVKEKVEEKVEEVKAEVKEKVEEAKEKVNAEIEKQKQKMIEEAEKTRSKLIQEATAAGTKLVTEAENQSAKIQAEAKNPIEKKAKQKAGEALVKKAKADSTKLVTDATTRGDKIVTDTKAQAEKLNQKE